MASLRVAACNLTRAFRSTITVKQTLPQISQVLTRNSSYKSSEKYDETKEYPEFEVSYDPKEWEYVERLLPLKAIPKPKTDKSVCGWKAATALVDDYPYFVQRSRNHMQPVYLLRTFRGARRVTSLRNIEGDIWALNNELQPYIEEKLKRKVPTKVNEFAQFIKYKTDCVKYVKEWLDQKGF